MRLTTTLAVLLALSLPLYAQELSERPYPQGNAFPLGLYSLDPREEMPQVTPFGWNIGHSYHFDATYLDAALSHGLYALARLPRVEGEVTWDTIRERIAQYAAYENVVWWDFPEELRYWEPTEAEMLARMSQLTRELDPMQRPNYMYMPTHVTAARIATDAPHLDIIGCGAYTEYHHMPRAWIRYAIEREIEGIRRAGFEVGQDYLAGQKTPIAVLQLFYQPENMSIISPIDARHDFWASIAAGARGVMIFSYWHKRDGGVLQATWEAYAQCAQQFTEAGLGPVILFGEPPEDLSFGVVRGPQMGAPFEPYGYDHEIRYPSLTVRAWTHEGSLHVLAVNSAERALTAQLSGLPEGATEAVALFETVTPEEGAEPIQRTVPITAGALEDSFAGLGVHIYRIALPG
ncbi:MAG: hypothetical protein AB7Y46_10470 [Armatimonadota bacterium]